MNQASLFMAADSDVADTNDDWYTPHWIFEALGIVFDLDVAAPVNPERRTCPAHHYLTAVDDGLNTPWHGVIWMNPPYSNTRPWAEKFISHANGLALVPVVRSSWLEELLAAADAITLVGVEFIRSTGRETTFRWMSLLAAIGEPSSSRLRNLVPTFTRREP